jgi:peroxiredoxin
MSHYEEDVVLVSPAAAKRRYEIISKRGLKFILTCDQSHLTHCFKQSLGVAPKQFQQA